MVLWAPAEESAKGFASHSPPKDWSSDEPGAYVDLHRIAGKIEKVDQNNVKYFLDLKPGEKQLVRYSVTYKKRKVGPDLNVVKKREPLQVGRKGLNRRKQRKQRGITKARKECCLLPTRYQPRSGDSQ